MFLVTCAFQHTIPVDSLHPVNSYILYLTLTCGSSSVYSLSIVEVQGMKKLQFLL
jgi:hypothetical protein